MKPSGRRRILHPKYVGALQPREAMLFCSGEEVYSPLRARITLSLLIDPTDGVIADAAFLVYGPSYLILAGDLLCELVVRKTHMHARQLRASALETAGGFFPIKEALWINVALGALDQALESCEGLERAVKTPVELLERDVGENYYDEFPLLSHSEKLALIETVLDDEIRPYIEMDAGGVRIDSLEGNELKILYEGACTSCYAATGSTLSGIQGILQKKVSPELVVTPVDLFQTS
ncbi:MAG: NifU family protein [Chlamydiota bacterium]